MGFVRKDAAPARKAFSWYVKSAEAVMPITGTRFRTGFFLSRLQTLIPSSSDRTISKMITAGMAASAARIPDWPSTAVRTSKSATLNMDVTSLQDWGSGSMTKMRLLDIFAPCKRSFVQGMCQRESRRSSSTAHARAERARVPRGRARGGQRGAAGARRKTREVSHPAT